MNTKNVILVAAMAAVLLVAAVGSASAANCGAGYNPVCNCGDTVMGDYTFGADLNCAGSGGLALTIGAANIVIDGAGYELTGNGKNWVAGVYNRDKTGAAVKNLNVSDFSNYGIYFSGEPNFFDASIIDHVIENCVIENCTVHEIGTTTQAGAHGIFLKGMSNSAIKGNDVYGVEADNEDSCESGGNGIFFYGGKKAGKPASQHNNITCNLLHDNQKAGFFTKMMLNDSIISYNNASGNSLAGISDVPGGIVCRCKKTDYNEISYNNLSNNHGEGLYVGGCHNTIKYNTIVGNTGTGINMGRGDGSDYNEISRNTVCSNTGGDIATCGDGAPLDIGNSCWFNFGDNNTCGSCTNCLQNNSIYCNYTCDSLTSVYYDFDEDGFYSNTPENCVCGVGACCNPGLFNSSGAAQHCAGGVCIPTVGNDPNDCDDSVVPELTYTISGTTTPAADTVNITNLNNNKEWAASIDGNFYNLTLNIGVDVNASETLQIVACEELPDHESNCNVSIHVPENIPGEDTDVNLTLNHYCLNYYPDYPYYTQEDANWSGPAVMQACIGHYYDIGDVPGQAVLNETGIANNTACNADLQYVDPVGMKETLNHNWMWPIGRNYGLYSAVNTTDGLNYMLHYTCYWQHLGPAPVPAYGDYSNWMVVRGIHTSEDPYPQSQGSYDIYGFWINDPNDGPETIGENTYKTVDQWTDEYYLNLTGVRDCDGYKYKYVGLFEPPEQPDREVRLVHSPARLDGPVKAKLMGLDVVKAAIDGVTKELVHYDAEFASVFAKTVASEPMLVTDDDGKNYYLVAFNVPLRKKLEPNTVPVAIEIVDGKTVKKIELKDREAVIEPAFVSPTAIKEERTLVVVIIDAEDGSFKEASWVADPVKYLPVSKREALEFVLKQAKEMKVSKKPVIELVYRDSSPYYPDWKITVDGKVFYVSQDDGTVSYDKPEPTLPPKLIEPTPIRLKPMPI